MKHYQVIIVGGGPAGSSCARQLVEAGIDCLILDKEEFPRQKICAGWITPQVFRDLGISPGEYPRDLTEFSALKIYLKGFPIIRPGTQYAIRRFEFDDWLLNRSGAEIYRHQAKHIWKIDGGYCVDGIFSADYLIGAGGTHCPVQRTFFRPEAIGRGARIVCLEEEFRFNWKDPICRLWFFRKNLPGYAWYVPKSNGWLNIGLGGNAARLNEQGISIQEHWGLFLADLKAEGLISTRSFKPRGYVYHLRGTGQVVRKSDIFLVGDAAGLATLDMGEGIGPAIRSGIKAARAIAEDEPYTLEGISRFSLLPPALRWVMRTD